MKAARIHRHGAADELRLEDAPRPEPGTGEVLIRVAVAGVNPADHKHRSGMFKDFVKYVFPKILGYDVAGVIEATGPGVRGLAPGDRVAALLDPMKAGGYAEFVTTLAEGCAVLPAGMDFETAAAAPCAALTGAQMVEEHLRPKPGQTVLITGATGMVGRFAVRAAKALGARVVAAVRPAYAEEATRLGADEVVALDGAAWSGAPFDGVIDTVGGPAATALAANIAPGAVILTAATDPLDAAKLPSPPVFVAVHPDGARLTAILRDLAGGGVTAPVVARYPLAEAGAAQTQVERGGVRGKVVLLVADA